MTQKKEKWFINKLLDVFKYKSLPLSPTERSILIAIASYADKNGKCDLYREQIANFLGMTKKNLWRHLTPLQTKKILTIKRQFLEGTKSMTKSTYVINIKTIIELSIDNNGHIEVNTQPQIEATHEPIVVKTNTEKAKGGDLNMRLPPPQFEAVKITSNKQLPKNHLKDIVQTGGLDALSPGMKVVQMTHDLYFDEFWACYPRKEKKPEALKIWRRERLDSKAEQIINDVKLRQARHDRWEDRSFIPLPSTYLNQEGWEDEIIERRKQGSQSAKSSNIPTAGNIVGYAEQLMRAAGYSSNTQDVCEMQDYMGREVDKKLR